MSDNIKSWGVSGFGHNLTQIDHWLSTSHPSMLDLHALHQTHVNYILLWRKVDELEAELSAAECKIKAMKTKLARAGL